MHKCVLLHCIYTLYGHIKYNFQYKFLFYSVLMRRHWFSGSNPGRTSTRTDFDPNRGSAEVRFAGQEISEKSDPVQVQVGQKSLWPEPTRTAATLSEIREWKPRSRDHCPYLVNNHQHFQGTHCFLPTYSTCTNYRFDFFPYWLFFFNTSRYHYYTTTRAVAWIRDSEFYHPL